MTAKQMTSKRMSVIKFHFLTAKSCEDDNIKKPFSKKKKKLVIDTKNWVEGESTKKGNKRYIFINENGVEVTLLPETGIKKGLTPKQIKK